MCRMLGSLTLYRRLLFEHVFSNEELRARVPFVKKEAPERLTIFGNGIAGIMAGATVSFVAAPVEHVKARLQIQYAAKKKGRLYTGPIDCSRKIVCHHLFPGPCQVSTHFLERVWLTRAPATRPRYTGSLPRYVRHPHFSVILFLLVGQL